MEMTTQKRYWYLKLGALAAVAGSLLGMVGNLIHPSTTGHSMEGVAHIISHASAWTPIHLTIAAGLILMLGGLTAICRSLSDDLAGTMAQFGYVAAISGITVGVILVTLDGLAAKHLADAWAAAPADQKTAALWAVNAEETMNFALAALFNILFAGVTYILIGLAVALGRVYPRYLGWIAVAAGIGSIVAGFLQAASGTSTGVTWVLTIIFPTIITVWTAVLGILLYRRAGRLANEMGGK